MASFGIDQRFCSILFNAHAGKLIDTVDTLPMEMTYRTEDRLSVT